MNFFSKVFGKSKKPRQEKRRSSLIESAISPTLPKEKETAIIYNPNQRTGTFIFSFGLCLWEMICGIKIYNRK
jgi:hypothetical protein